MNADLLPMTDRGLTQVFPAALATPPDSKCCSHGTPFGSPESEGM